MTDQRLNEYWIVRKRRVIESCEKVSTILDKVTDCANRRIDVGPYTTEDLGAEVTELLLNIGEYNIVGDLFLDALSEKESIS